MHDDSGARIFDWIRARADRLETPCYVYDPAAIRRRVRRVIDALPGVSLLYSMKANAHPSVVAALAAESVGFEVSSPAEVATARQFGNARVLYTGVAKTRESIAHAIRHDVRWFNGESVSDVLRVGEVAASLAVVVDVALRVNPGSLELETSLETAGRRSRFGMSPDAIRDSGLLHADLPGLRVNGFHGFYGSQVKSRNDLACVIGATSRALASFLPDSRATLERVSLGLGLPAPYDDAPTVDIDNLRDPILNEVLALRSLTGNPELEVCMEMGRYLVAGAGMFVTRVVDRKQSFGLNWLLVDGGMQSFYRPIMMRQGHRISAVRVTDRTPEFEVVSIGGSCMTSEDVYARDIALPRCEEGDLIVFHEAGAYGHSMSLVSFLGMKAAREYVLE